MSKAKKEYRDYNSVKQAIKDNYETARTYQSLPFINHLKNKFLSLSTQLNIWDALMKLNDLVDVSDPDMNHPNLYHAIQTAEMIRKDGHPEWLQLIGLIHDLGKIMFLNGKDDEGTGKNKQWAMVGDTFIVGCQIPETIIFPEFNYLSPYHKYSTLGIYQKNCGLDNVICSWGHDEYLYRLLKMKENENSLPEEALYIIRYHSLYLYHEKGEYSYFLSEKDHRMLPYLKLFNKYDLYSKSDDLDDIANLKPYYVNLIKKFFKSDILRF